jgi:hypothetical protein
VARGIAGRPATWERLNVFGERNFTGDRSATLFGSGEPSSGPSSSSEACKRLGRDPLANFWAKAGVAETSSQSATAQNAQILPVRQAEYIASSSGVPQARTRAGFQTASLSEFTQSELSSKPSKSTGPEKIAEFAQTIKNVSNGGESI